MQKSKAKTGKNMMGNLRRDFKTRAELIEYLKSEFPEADRIDHHVSDLRGGRAAAIDKLSKINPETYGSTRNYTNGDVTHLSPYHRHGILDINETRSEAHKIEADHLPVKFVQQLAWRDYFQRIYDRIGPLIWSDREPYKTGFTQDDYADKLPKDIIDAETGLACIDSFSKELRETGYLHNHSRMWMAAYIVHWRRIKWQSGARWFLQHLLDGDPASNNLSWQWVASTFSHKPYFFNRENLEKYSDGEHCRSCPLLGKCSFEGSYVELEKKLFPLKEPSPDAKPLNLKRRKRWHN